MSVCPNCGAPAGIGKFCENCGTALPVEQNVQPEQQVQAQQPQPVQDQPVQPQPAPQIHDQQPPQAIPVQPVYQQPIPVQPVYQQPLYQQPGYQQSYQQPGYQQGYQQPGYQPQGYQPQGYQPRTPYVRTPKKSTNVACIVGFILGLVGIFTLGAPSVIGFIVSTIGVIVAFVKKQKGKVLGIFGIILSLIMIAGWILLIQNSDKIQEAMNSNAEGQSLEEWFYGDSYEGKAEIISETEWIEKNSGTRLIFGSDDYFQYFNDYRVTNNYYYTGTYEIYFGYEAIRIIDEDYSRYGYTSDYICDKIDNERGVAGVKDFMVLVLHNDGYWVNEVNTHDLKWDTLYMGYYDNNRLVMNLIYLEDNKDYTFVSRNDIDVSKINMPDTYITEPTDAYELYWGTDLSGRIELNQGEWNSCEEYDEMDYSYLENNQLKNPNTGTRIQLSIISGLYNPVLAEQLANEFKDTMEDDYDYEVSKVEETTLGGYTAYSVTAQYEDGEYLSAWFFVDEERQMHYVTVVYYDSDVISYEMVRDTYILERK